MDILERTLKALADKNRLRIIGLLSHKKMCVCEIGEVLRITQPSVSKHLKKLKAAGIIDAEQDGLWTNYWLSTDKKCCAPELVQLIERLTANDPQIKGDLRAARKVDREKICCR